jgi:hypothetical protein
MIATIAGKMVGKFKIGDGGEQDRAGHKAHDAHRVKDKTPLASQARVSGLMMRAEGRVSPARGRLINTASGAAVGFLPPPILMRRTA